MYELYLGLWYESQDDLFLLHPVPPYIAGFFFLLSFNQYISKVMFRGTKKNGKFMSCSTNQ